MARLPADRRHPLAARLDPARPDHARIVAAHEQALADGASTYLDPATGFEVFTAHALWDRERCCASGCRHCPYGEGPRVPAPEPSGSQSPRGIE